MTQQPEDKGGRPGIAVQTRMDQGEVYVYVTDPLANTTMRLPLILALQVVGIISAQAAAALAQLRAQAQDAGPRLLVPK